MGHFLHQAAQSVLKFGHYGLDAAAALTGNPELIPAIEGVNSGAQTYAKTGNLGSALKSGALSAGGSFIGSNIGAALFPGAGNVADALEKGLGSDFGSAVSNVVGGTIANTGLGALGGGFAGNSLASSLAPENMKGRQAVAASGLPPAFQPSQQAQSSLPMSLQSLGGLTPMQQATNVATGGVFGGGQGPDEQSFFTNLVNRQLVDSSGKVNNLSTLNPIENSYLQQLGLGGYGNSTDLLQAISKFKPS